MSSKMDLGFDTNIKRVGEGDSNPSFTVQQTEYHTSKLLYSVGAEEATGWGTQLLEVKDGEGNVRAVKDCWIKDHPGKQMEHDIVADIKSSMGSDFRKYFINICGHHKEDTPGAFSDACDIPKKGPFVPKDHLRPQPIPTSDPPRPTYTNQDRDPITDQEHLQPLSTEQAPENLPCLQFHYQVVYKEKGTPLFEVTPFAAIFGHIGQAEDGMRQDLRNLQTCLHFEPSTASPT